MDLTEAFDSIASQRVVMFGGKGGVGKTTVSCLAALHYAQSRKVILFTTDPASNLRDLLGETPNVVIEEVDAQDLYRKFLDENLKFLLEIGDRGTYLDREELQRFFELSLPGIDELMSWNRIGELAEANPDAIVVVDTAPTGHTLRMLGSGDHFRQFAEALDAMEAKHRGMVRQFMRKNVRDAIDDYIDKFDDDAKRRRALMTTFVPVFLSEPWVVEQTLRLIEEVDLQVPFAVLNRAVLDVDCDLDRERARRDGEARKRFENVVDLPRRCTPFEVSVWRRAPPLAATSDGARRHTATCDLRPANFLFLAGKGGVGKTTCAASIALQLAQKHPGRRYTIISVDPAHALRDVFAHERPPANLAVEIVDTKTKWENFRATLGDEIDRAIGAITPGNMSIAYDAEAMQKLIDIAPPGADELFAISRLAELADDKSQAMVIVDTAPTGHFLRLLELPKTAGDWVHEFMRLLLHYKDLVPPGSLGQELVKASKAMHSLEAALKSDRTGTIVVTRPERIVVAETNRLIESLKERQMRITGVIANYVTPKNECKCDQSMRKYEEALLAGLATLTVERREKPVTRLADLATLFRVASD